VLDLFCLKRSRTRHLEIGARGDRNALRPVLVGMPRAALILTFAGLVLSCGFAEGWGAQKKDPRLRRKIEEARRLKIVGRFEQAKELFRSLYESYPDDEVIVSGFGETLLMSKDWGEAEELYLEVRDRSGNPRAFAKELEQVHMLQGRYQEAAGDCMDMLANQPGRMDWIRGELVRISKAADEGLDLVLNVLSERARLEPDQPLFEILAIEMLARGARYDEVMQRLETLRELGQVSANHLFSLAVQLESLGDVGSTILALRLSLTKQGTVGDISGSAFKLSELLAAAGRPEESRTVLEHLAERYPNSTLAFRARLELASLESKSLGRPDRALALYEELLAQKKLPIKENEVKEAIAGCLMRMGRLDEARAGFAELAGGMTELQPRASFMAAEISFFMGETDSAVSLYSALAGDHPEWEHANDALGRLFLIQESAGEGMEPLGLYATAELLSTIDRPDSALTYITSILEKHPDSPLVDDAMFRAGELYLELGDVDHALTMCRFVIEYDPEGRLAPLAHERLGDIWWEERGDGNRALEEYTKGLDRYPNSLVAPRVRDKVSRLRREVG
jgi:tetratricopeptide (TPR) repeat protein